MTMNEEWDKATEEASPITTMELDRLAVELYEASAKVDAKKLEMKEVNADKDEKEKALISALETAGKKKYYVEGVGTFGFVDKLSVRTPKSISDKQAFAGYLEKQGGKDLFWSTFSINSRTLGSYYNEEYKAYKDKVESGEIKDGPFHIPGIDEPTNMRSLRLTKEKK